MGIFDRARDALEKHADKIDPLVDRVADEADKRTGGQHDAHIDRAGDPVKDKLGDQGGRDATSQPGTPA